jgi:hypothetical protein
MMWQTLFRTLRALVPGRRRLCESLFTTLECEIPVWHAVFTIVEGFNADRYTQIGSSTARAVQHLKTH